MKKTVFKLSALLVSLAVAMALAELLIRVSGVWVGRHSDTMFTVMDYDPVLGWKMKPSVAEKVSFVDVENIPVRANSLGFWDREFKQEKDPQRRRIAFLGDSFTWGLGVQEGERFSNVLQSSNQKLESLNFGVPGYGTDQSLLVWRNIASRFQPDVVVLTVYSNDYVDNMFVIRSGLRKPYFEFHDGSQLQLKDMAGNTTNFWNNGIFNEAAPPYAALFPAPEKRSRVLHWLVKHSDLARLGYTIIRHGNEAEQPGVATVSAQENTKRTEAKSVADLPVTEKAEVALLDALVKQLAAEVSASGAKFLVVFAGPPNSNFGVQKVDLDTEHIPHIDATTEVLAAKLPGGVKELYFPYNKHWTAAGHRVVAEMIAGKLREEKWY